MEERNHLHQSHLRQSRLCRHGHHRDLHEIRRGNRREELRDLLWEQKPFC